MTVWWGLAGLLGLLGCCGLLRSHRADGTAVADDPLERYPVAREPAMPNADAAHTPLMTPAITPEMLARPALPQQEAAVPEAGRMAGEIPAPRPQSGGVGERPGVPSGGVRPEPVGISAAPRAVAVPERASAAPRAVQAAPRQAAGESQVGASGAPVEVPRDVVQPATEPMPQQSAEVRVPQQPKHALHAEAAAPETSEVPEARAAEETRPEEAAPRPATSPPPDSGGLIGKLRRLLRRT